MSYQLDSDVTSYLQDLGDACGEVLGGLLQEELFITDDNQSDFREALAAMMKALTLVEGLKVHKYREPVEPDDATQPVWARQVEAAF